MSAFDELERRLSVTLPGDYARFLAGAAEQQSAEGTFYADPDVVLVKTLELRDPERGMPPHLEAGVICVGDDGCGNLFLCDTVGQRILFWDHEADAFEDRGPVAEALVDQRARPNDLERVPGLCISRVRPAWKSILQPITRSEWAAVAERDPDLRYPAHREGMNPFTKQPIVIPAHGRAQWHGRNDVSLIHHDGRIGFHGRPAAADREVRDKMAELATALGAEVVEVSAEL